MTPGEAAEVGVAILDAVGGAVVGKREAVELVLAATLADGHVLVEDLPGVGKTLLVRSLGAATGLGHSRIQFTPDLMPLDITGSTVLDSETRQPRFHPGPVFAHLLLADEINRAPAKTQAALLEAMQERQVTIDGVTHALEPPFLVVATQNPIEYEGTYPLPEAQMDRFLVRVDLGYPNAEDEWEILRARAERKTDHVDITPVIDRETFLRMQRTVEDVHVSPPVGRYIVEVIEATRSHHRTRVGVSPRGSLALMRMARARAALSGRDFLVPDDVQEVAVPALAHRLILRPEAWAAGVGERSVIEACLASVPVPAVAPERR